MSHKCDGCSKFFSERRHLHRHEGKCSKLKEQADRQWKLMREAERDPEVRKKRRLAQEECPDNPTNPFERFRNLVSRQKVKTSSSSSQENALGERCSRLAADNSRQPMATHHQPSPEPMDSDNVSLSLPLVPENTLPATRIRRLTERAKAMLEDELPDGAGDLLDEDCQPDDHGPSSHDLPSSTLRIRIRRLVKTMANKFGLVRTYHGRPSGIPQSRSLDFLADALHPAPNTPPCSLPMKKSIIDIIHPYPNLSSFLFNRWHWDGGKKTKKSRTDFVESVAKHPDFKIGDIIGVNFDHLDAKLAENPGGVVEDNGWTQSSVPIYIPTGKKETKASK